MILSADTPDVTGLIELSRDPQLDLKPVILRVQTDLFLAAPIRDRAALKAFASLACGLIPIVDEETALTVARKLGPFAETPETVLACLAARGGRTCEAVIEGAVVVGPAIIEAALGAGAEIGPAIAARAERDRASGAGRMRARDTAPRTERADLEDRIAKARRDSGLAADLLAHPDLAPADLAPLWLHADAARREAIQDAVGATAGLRPSPAAPRDLGARLAALSRGGDVTGFRAALAEGLGLPSDFLSAAPDPASRYDLLTLCLRAADVSEAEAVFIFLTLNQTVARSADRVFALVQLFRSLGRSVSRDLLSAILGAALPARNAAGHVPYAAPDVPRPRPGAPERVPARTLLPGRARQSV